MTLVRRFAVAGLLVLCLTAGFGCSTVPHFLQVDQLQKLNRGPAPYQQEFFSVSDSVPEAP